MVPGLLPQPPSCLNQSRPGTVPSMQLAWITTFSKPQSPMWALGAVRTPEDRVTHLAGSVGAGGGSALPFPTSLSMPILELTRSSQSHPLLRALSELPPHHLAPLCPPPLSLPQLT